MADERYELLEDVSQSRLYNKDLAPTSIKERTWNTYNYTALWVGMAHCVPTYTLAASLIALGMNWLQAILTITLGNLIVLVPILLNSHPGAKYGISFPVLARASFGVNGANIPALLRAIVACGWFGINTFIGGSALNVLMNAIFPGWAQIGGKFAIAGLSIPVGICFMIFWFAELFIIYKGMDVLKKFENVAAPLVMALAAVLLIYMIVKAHGLGAIINKPSSFKNTGDFLRVFFPSLTAMVGFWATLSLNIPDFTRFAKSQKKQMAGQALGLPITMTVFSLMGIFITSSATLLYKQEIWQPVDIVSKFRNPLAIFIGFFGIIVASLSVNVAANIVSPSYDFSNFLPKFISFKTGGLITGIIGILIMPWKLLADPSGYIFNWLGTYSGILGPIAAILIFDYWVLRKKKLNLTDLYKTEGEYTYKKGFNPKAIIALVIGIVFALIGKVVPPLAILADYAWFLGFAVSFVVYWLLNKFGKTVVVTESKVGVAEY
jgi:NCS1 family nucleobase:cation symporter-1